MQILKRYVTIDAADIDTEAAFWAGMLGGRIAQVDSGSEQWRDVVIDGEVVLGIQHDPDHVPPRWPPVDPRDQRQQIHWDLYVERDALPDAQAEAIARGATLLQEAEHPEAPHGFTVLADPAGHPFCLCWG